MAILIENPYIVDVDGNPTACGSTMFIHTSDTDVRVIVHDQKNGHDVAVEACEDGARFIVHRGAGDPVCIVRIFDDPNTPVQVSTERDAVMSQV